MNEKFEKIFIEITNFCGLDCSFCTPKKQAKEIMSLENFDKIIQKISPYTSLCALHILGDPLSIKNLSPYLKIAQSHNLKLEITSSGFYLEDKIDLLLNSPCIHQINISLMSALYQSKTINLEEYFQPILKLCNTHQQLKSEKFINLRLWNLDTNFNPPALNTKIYNLLKQNFLFQEISPLKIRLNYKIFLHQARMFEWANVDSQNLHKKGFCYGGIKQLGILCNGIVVPCCFDAKGAINLGNILEESLKEILLKQRAKALVQGFKNNNLVELLCQSCNYPQYLASKPSCKN
ncbi:radical SAM/SPASM domain-containing protein [Helicobacter mesocricetorum]|uniref:radical SAM/SPASM domain-containing protein n=1 Tax=Helicobacter mesocricetorum TaxID=87012 RepID=UPI000CF04445|nr:radical SAM/SPASM domain-containing protein [Helicobacter mesocricetorum]